MNKAIFINALFSTSTFEWITFGSFLIACIAIVVFLIIVIRYVTYHHLIKTLETTKKKLEKEKLDKNQCQIDLSKQLNKYDDQRKSAIKFLASAEKARKEAEVAYSKINIILDSTQTGLFLVNSAGKIRFTNTSAEKMFGYSREELEEQNIHSLVPQKSRTEHVTLCKNFLKHPETRKMGAGRDLFGLRKDGTEFHAEIGLTDLEIEDERYILVIIIDITKRKKIEKQMKRTNQELEQFAYIASHDLQEPLRMVESYMNLLEERYKDHLDETANEFIHYAVDGSKRMKLLIDDLREYSQVGMRPKHFVQTDMNKVVEKVILNLQLLIEEKNPQITKDDLPFIMADEIQMCELLQNFICNAIKFCDKETPEIHIGVESRDNRWIFSVKDNGIGINKENFDRIFMVFQRLHTRQEYNGTGIGLAICKKIADRHGGRIWVSSKEGLGSTFYFSVQK